MRCEEQFSLCPACGHVSHTHLGCGSAIDATPGFCQCAYSAFTPAFTNPFPPLVPSAGETPQ